MVKKYIVNINMNKIILNYELEIICEGESLILEPGMKFREYGTSSIIIIKKINRNPENKLIVIYDADMSGFAKIENNEVEIDVLKKWTESKAMRIN